MKRDFRKALFQVFTTNLNQIAFFSAGEGTTDLDTFFEPTTSLHICDIYS